MKLAMKLYYTALCCVVFVVQLSAQVGFNNTSPDPSSVLDLTATDKGILIPRVTTTQRLAIVSPAESLLVYDATENRFYYFSNSQWNTLDSWTKISGGVNYNGQVGVNASTPNASSTLDVSSTTKGMLIPRMTTTQRQAITSPAQSLLVFDTTDSRFYFYNAGNWYAVNALDRLAGSNNITHTGNLTVNGTISATGYSGLNVTGTIPTGGIIMWSGSIASIPAGWALCNGASGTPDLRDRFIVGAGNTYVPGNTGGANSITLTAAQSGSPAHSHPYTDPGHVHSYSMATTLKPQSGSATQCLTATQSTSTAIGYTNIVINNNTPQNASQAFDNRPAYYALAYIMKL